METKFKILDPYSENIEDEMAALEDRVLRQRAIIVVLAAAIIIAGLICLLTYLPPGILLD